jgi:hypothetical protein
LRLSPKDLRSLRKEVNKHKDCRDIAKLKKLVEKRDFLKLRVEALETEAEQFRAQQQKQLSLLEKDLHEKYSRTHGLLAYGIATGGLSPDATLLYDTLGDFLASKSDSDRASAQRAVNLILDHGNLGPKDDEAGPDDAILRQFEEIEDPERRSAFFRKHRDAIQRAFDARQNNNS